MPSSEKVTILLADEDALRRDGLAAVLAANMQFEVIAQCSDGEEAIDQIRALQPDVAVLDLNLPALHGIELVRRVRSEMLGTKIVILSGTTDDGIIREVVRAGGDAYLLKNGPARHLIDAISYVRDGGQYFSPQLRRDGLDRRLLEESPRVSESAAREENFRTGRQRSSRRPSGRGGGPQRFRDRLRADTEAEHLGEHDYEVLNVMAESIRPILDRLDEIEGRVGDMEAGEAPVPGNVRGWLNNQIADTFGDSRSSGRDIAPGRTMGDLEARLPQLIEQAVTNRFRNMASKLQQEIEETHVRTLETFVKNIQVKLVQRVSALETDMSRQAEAMTQLREYSQRTEDNLGRLIAGVDKLATELPRRLADPGPAPPQAPDRKPAGRRSARPFSPKTFWAVVAVVVIIGIAAVQVFRGWKDRKSSGSPTAAQSGLAAGAAISGAAVAGLTMPPETADTNTKLQAAQAYMERKDFSMAEDVYRQVLKAEPNNIEALKSLASVLYRQDKIEESAAILDKLPKTGQ
jgi:DNA-binding NarL/FixJ family response regulator/TolA-binding protein